ncbi:unnamed protein product [Orchesella dallaii]|uniref:RING-type domain-containing protein n=1 Tax=Orchesella dallaii TaxID=48710 RepID=A0ABP1PHR0_9HEXA
MEEHQSCPICFHIPEKEIYQCLNGHIVCAECSAKLTECPQCREPFPEPKSRNLVLEQLLDALTFDCLHKDEGCDEVFKREDISKHAAVCYHRKNGMNLCAKVGIKNCDHQVDITSPSQIIQHFEEIHSASSQSGNVMYIWHTDIAGATTLSVNSRWNPIIIRLESEGIITALFMIVGRVDIERDTASWSCVQLFRSSENTSEVYDVEFGIFGKDENSRVLPIRWIIPVIYPEDDIEYSRIEIPLWFVGSLCLKNKNIPIRVKIQTRDFDESTHVEKPPELFTFSCEEPVQTSDDAGKSEPKLYQ